MADIDVQSERQVDPSQRKGKRVNTLIALGYNGTNYNGSQMQGGKNALTTKTIEGELVAALDRIGLMEGRTVQQLGICRVSRTDTSVSAACTILSFMVSDQLTLAQRLNEELPADIRVFGAMRVTPHFDGRSYCTSRKYEYFVPKIWFKKSEIFAAKRAWFLDEVRKLDLAQFSDHVRKFANMELTVEYEARYGELEYINRILEIFCQANHYYANYTTEVDRMSETKRKMMRFEALDFDDSFYLVKIEGQAFLYNQIRKMIGAVTVLLRGQAPLSWFVRSLTGREEYRTEVATMPGEYLLLDRQEFAGFEKHNDYKLYGTLIQDQPDVVKAAEQFKQDVVYKQILSTNPEVALQSAAKLDQLHEDCEVQLKDRVYKNTAVPCYFQQGLDAINREIEVFKVLQERRVTVQVDVPADKVRSELPKPNTE